MSSLSSEAISMTKYKNNTLVKLRNYVDGEADTPYEYFMLLVIIINTISIGIETSTTLSDNFRKLLTITDQICLFIFIAELLFKAVVYNRNFFGEKRIDENGDEYFHINRWNISDLLIVLVSSFSTLPYFAVFRTFRILRSFKIIKAIRSFRIVKSFKLVNEVSSLRTIFKGLLKAIPGIIATFSFLAIFAYAYAIIGTNIFSEEFPQFFGSLGTSILTLCQVTTFDSWFSGITRPITQVYPWAWIYFVSYAFIAASVIMNVIVGIIVDSMGKERERQKEKESQNKITMEQLSEQILELQKKLDNITKLS